MNPLYPVVAFRAAIVTSTARAPEAIFNLPFEIEHIIPSSHNSPDDDSNYLRYLAARANCSNQTRLKV